MLKGKCPSCGHWYFGLGLCQAENLTCSHCGFIIVSPPSTLASEAREKSPQNVFEYSLACRVLWPSEEKEPHKINSFTEINILLHPKTWIN